VAQPERPVRRIKLTGARFEGGRLPVDSLIELERYQELLRIVARASWESEHPGEPLPADFNDDVSLTIESIEAGSADIILAFEQHASYVEYQQRADDTVSEALAAAYEARELPEMPPVLASEVKERITHLGETLDPGQAIEVYTAGAAAEPIKITIEARHEVIDNFAFEDFVSPPAPTVATELETLPETVVGRITELDADKATYRFESLRYGRLIGHYDPESTMLDDIRDVLNSTTEAPVLRVVGALQYRHGAPWRFKETHQVEEFAGGSKPWANRLIELAQLPTGWGDGDDGVAIEVAALEAAGSILAAISEFNLPQPGVFPTEEGGVLVEWATTEQVRSIEITSDLDFELFSRPAGGSGALEVSPSLEEAIAFARGERG
jgi:hypothetical protein